LSRLLQFQHVPLLRLEIFPAYAVGPFILGIEFVSFFWDSNLNNSFTHKTTKQYKKKFDFARIHNNNK
jgi:hypothetical protein